MKAEELKERTKAFAIKVMKLVEALPKNQTAESLRRQLFRSATSVGANYRAACRARSQADFVSKINVVEEEADESAFWLELLLETTPDNSRLVTSLLNEARELTAIFTASGRTAKRGLR